MRSTQPTFRHPAAPTDGPLRAPAAHRGAGEVSGAPAVAGRRPGGVVGRGEPGRPPAAARARAADGDPADGGVPAASRGRAGRVPGPSGGLPSVTVLAATGARGDR